MESWDSIIANRLAKIHTVDVKILEHLESIEQLLISVDQKLGDEKKEDSDATK